MHTSSKLVNQGFSLTVVLQAAHIWLMTEYSCIMLKGLAAILESS